VGLWRHTKEAWSVFLLSRITVFSYTCSTVGWMRLAWQSEAISYYHLG
jgi:hypothetical protein